MKLSVQTRSQLTLVRMLRIDGVFISFHHQDRDFKDKLAGFVEHIAQRYKGKLGKEILSKWSPDVSVSDGSISTRLSDRAIKEAIEEEFILHALVTIVLIGSETHTRKFVDWEIAASLKERHGHHPDLSRGPAGLLGVVLPTSSTEQRRGFDHSIIPPRLADNLRSGYAKLYSWKQISNPKSCYRALVSAIVAASGREAERIDRIDNSRAELVRNKFFP
ncbi:MAG TPA: TIR domain-containing protein [Thermoanaerobaculia bacterium]|nr:TIR domain-containing protein [Thermoanaerobaculia bacterium]